MLLAALSLTTLLAMPLEAPVVAAPSLETAFPTIATDQSRPSPQEVRAQRAKLLKQHGRTNWDCFQYYGCYPLSAPPSQQWCVYTGYPNNGCLIDAYGNCDLCQVCCENCFC